MQLFGELEQLPRSIGRPGVVAAPEAEDEPNVHEIGKVFRWPTPAKALDTLGHVLLRLLDPPSVPFGKGQLAMKSSHDVVVTLIALQPKRLPPEREPVVSLSQADTGFAELFKDLRQQFGPVAGPDQVEGRPEIAGGFLVPVAASRPF